MKTRAAVILIGCLLAGEVAPAGDRAGDRAGVAGGSCRGVDPPVPTSHRQQNIRLERRQLMMGDIAVSITVIAPERKKASAWEVMGEAFDEARRIEQRVSEFLPESDTSRLNRSAGEAPLKVGRDLIRILKLAQKVSRRTDGAFDITFASPDPNSTWRDVSTARLEKGVRIGLSGIAKGYIVDRMSELLIRRGFGHHLVNAGGGDLKAVGRDLEGPWQVGITDPDHPRGRPLCRLTLKDQAAASSGTYERGRHIIDPRTDRPVVGVKGVTVVARSSAVADALATGFFVIGEGATAKLKGSGADALLLISQDGKVTTAGHLPGDCP